ncbi:STAS-like domain-containing protein [Caulobacter sp. FWC2]|uniref:STAS-like domain-containing protein n=1 Tax=Caulobacter sp. FWC2 TaxID=69664 RepID=UPI000C145AC8|nr:STAS-like domain-containing protein [Caulobacter sp. FWC2]PIB89932.1 DUF4325 domain-containing protein [Caulobacter sp. FWC2]
MTKVVDVATQFDRYPFGRYPSHGPNNGQRFREEFLIPDLQRGVRLVVDLSHAEGLAPSFLEEAFGGLVRAGFSPTELKDLLDLKSEVDPSLIDEVQTYIDDEWRRRANSQH